MKGAVLTFVGLFILGCGVGIGQVLIILHVRSKRSAKQSGLYSKAFLPFIFPFPRKLTWKWQ